MANRNVASGALLLLVALTVVASGEAAYVASDWISNTAHATFYGGNDASGTQGGDPVSQGNLLTRARLYICELEFELEIVMCSQGGCSMHLRY